MESRFPVVDGWIPAFFAPSGGEKQKNLIPFFLQLVGTGFCWGLLANQAEQKLWELLLSHACQLSGMQLEPEGLLALLEDSFRGSTGTLR